MSDDEKRRTGSVRRVGPKDRKRTLDSAGSLFPPSPATSPEDAPSPPTPAPQGEGKQSERIEPPSAETSSMPDSGDASAATAPDVKPRKRKKPKAQPSPPAPRPQGEGSEAAQQDTEPVGTHYSASAPSSDTVPTVDAPPPAESAPPVAPRATKPKRARDDVPLPWRDEPGTTLPPLPPVKLPKTAPAPVPAKHRRFTRHDGIALLFLLATVAVLIYGAQIVQDPYTALNPLPPHTPLPIVITATFEPTLTSTDAPTATLGPTQTFTPLPAAILTDIAPTRDALLSVTEESTPEATAAP